jgi:NhaA family Na+:H+ antiporter
VVLALLTPAGPVAGRPILNDLLRVVGPVSAFVAVPIFALANTGLHLGYSVLSEAAHAPVFWAVLLALLLGKFLGVAGAIAATVGCKLGHLPDEVRPGHVVGLGCIAGLGFTVALFVTDLAYTDIIMIQHIKIGIFAASVLAAIAAAITLAVTDLRNRSVARSTRQH